jgi:hypothetical protein
MPNTVRSTIFLSAFLPERSTHSSWKRLERDAWIPLLRFKVWQPVKVKRKKDEGLTGLLSRFLLVRWQKISLWLRLGASII